MKNAKTLTKKINATKTPDELLAILGKDYFDIADISYRGGNLGFYGSFIAEFVGTDDWLLPNKFGAYSNYLGGGLRGAIVASNYNSSITGVKADLLNAIGKAIIRAYNYYEAGDGLQDETDENSEINWENLGTNKSRQAGVISAY